MAKNTIIVKSYNNNRDQVVATAVAITPGMLLERTSAGLVQAHSAAGGVIASKIFAMEDAFQGKKITDNYAVSVPIYVNTTGLPCSLKYGFISPMSFD